MRVSTTNTKPHPLLAEKDIFDWHFFTL